MLRSLILASLIVLAGHAPIRAAEPTKHEQAETEDTKGPPIVFIADLSAEEESAVTDSPGVGHLECVLERATLKFSWKLTYRNLSTPVIGAGFHGPQTPGGEAGVLIDIPASDLKSPIQGSATLTEGQLEYLLVGRMYVQIRTSKFPVGEIRGQLQRQRPKAPTT